MSARISRGRVLDLRILLLGLVVVLLMSVTEAPPRRLSLRPMVRRRGDASLRWAYPRIRHESGCGSDEFVPDNRSS